MRARLFPDALAGDYAAFSTALGRIEALLPADIATLAPLDRAALRVLIVHRWRRLLLNHPDLPDAFFPDGWPGAELRERVHAVLDQVGSWSAADLAETALV